MIAAAVIAACAGIATAAAAIFAARFAWDIWKAGGLRALHAGLTGTTPPAVPAAESPRAAVAWWEDPGAGLRENRPPKPWEPVTPPAVTGVPPWDPAAASQGTGYTKFHADDLRRLLGRGAATPEPAALQAHTNGIAPGGAESGD